MSCSKHKWELIIQNCFWCAKCGTLKNNDIISQPTEHKVEHKKATEELAELAGLTGQQKEILNFIGKFIGSKGYSPTIREIGEALNITSTNGVDYHLQILERNGLIKRSNMKSRTITINKRGK